MSDGVTLFANYYRPIALRGIYAETWLRYLDGPLIRRDSLARALEFRMLALESAFEDRASPFRNRSGGEIAPSAPGGRCLLFRNIGARAVTLCLRSRCAYDESPRFVDLPATREAIPLNRRFGGKRREDSEHEMGQKGPCNKTIGLDVMPPSRRDEAEVTWQYVLQDRRKRKSTNSVTAYCERIAKVYSKNPPPLPKPPQKMRLLDRVKVKHVPERPPPLPPLVPNIVSMCYPALPMPGENGMKQHCKVVDVKIVDDNGDENIGGKKERSKWTGIEEMMLAYKEYSKDKALEKKVLASETSRLVAHSNNLRSETMQLERRMYELLSARTALDSERRVLCEKIERINALVRNLR